MLKLAHDTNVRSTCGNTKSTLERMNVILNIRETTSFFLENMKTQLSFSFILLLNWNCSRVDQNAMRSLRDVFGKSLNSYDEI